MSFIILPDNGIHASFVTLWDIHVAPLINIYLIQDKVIY